MNKLKIKYLMDKKAIKIGLINVVLQFAFNKTTSQISKHTMNKLRERKKLLKI